MEIVVLVLAAGLAFTLVRLIWLDRLVQRLAKQTVEHSMLLDKLTGLMVQSGEILLDVVKRGEK